MSDIFKKTDPWDLPKTPGKKAGWLEEIMNSSKTVSGRDKKFKANDPNNPFEIISAIPAGFSRHALKKGGTSVLLLTPKDPAYLPKDRRKDLYKELNSGNAPEKKVGKDNEPEEGKNRRWGYYRSCRMC